MKLLRIDASSRIENSDSRKIADLFQKHWEQKNTENSVIIRDIIHTPIPHIQQKTIEGFYTPTDQLNDELQNAIELSNTLIAELKEVDILLISTPMYNFSIPSALKAWIDHIVRINSTFGVNEEGGFYGMIEGVKAYIITSAGAVYDSQEMKALDFLQPYLQTVLGLIGITDVTFLPLEGTTMNEEVFLKTKENAKDIINNI
ncbi:FMN-dependent NADH-azoreductase [Aquimarina litoralis]|uniref:FMN-dependent NADH-azoreductase n=1 Tax=Aquimarina litoralis TaxID=584605 RepID=UPI001C56C5C7|nr:NAD(P)H-dependent oxidoreductase [Aquimarina litoralis]MBW1295430.1 FMN-dependent NADH-azoreductase [Aquimarina litoralis]